MGRRARPPRAMFSMPGLARIPSEMIAAEIKNLICSIKDQIKCKAVRISTAGKVKHTCNPRTWKVEV